jgi:uncharacterized membrane protein YjgN (DUF898 family)
VILVKPRFFAVLGLVIAAYVVLQAVSKVMERVDSAEEASERAITRTHEQSLVIGELVAEIVAVQEQCVPAFLPDWIESKKVPMVRTVYKNKTIPRGNK